MFLTLEVNDLMNLVQQLCYAEYRHGIIGDGYTADDVRFLRSQVVARMRTIDNLLWKDSPEQTNENPCEQTPEE